MNDTVMNILASIACNAVIIAFFYGKTIARVDAQGESVRQLSAGMISAGESLKQLSIDVGILKVKIN